MWSAAGTAAGQSRYTANRFLPIKVRAFLDFCSAQAEESLRGTPPADF